MAEIILNGERVLIEDEKICSLYEFVCKKVKNPDTVVVEYNGEIVTKDTWEKVDLKSNDRIEIIRFVGGG